MNILIFFKVYLRKSKNYLNPTKQASIQNFSEFRDSSAISWLAILSCRYCCPTITNGHFRWTVFHGRLPVTVLIHLIIIIAIKHIRPSIQIQ